MWVKRNCKLKLSTQQQISLSAQNIYKVVTLVFFFLFYHNLLTVLLDFFSNEFMFTNIYFLLCFCFLIAVRDVLFLH